MKRKVALRFKCIRCGGEAESFGSRSKFCIKCRKLSWKLFKVSKNWENSEAGKNYQREYQKKHRLQFKSKVFDHYGWKCNCCGEVLISMLTIDHVNNDGYKDRKQSIEGTKLYKHIIKLNYPDTFQILCMNCNWSKKINKGICQHKM